MGNRERAGDGIRTHDNNVGNVVLYQLSYARRSKNLPVCQFHSSEERGLRYERADYMVSLFGRKR